MDYDVGKQFEIMQAKLDFVVEWIRKIEDEAAKSAKTVVRSKVERPVAEPVAEEPVAEEPVEEVPVEEAEEVAEEEDLFENAEEVEQSPVPLSNKKPVAKKRRWT